MTVLNLHRFPDVCRLCFNVDSRKMHALDDDFKTVRQNMQTFLDEITFRVDEEKRQDMPKSICNDCLEKLTSFAIYRNQLLLILRLMEALVDAKKSNYEPLNALFRDRKSELKSALKEVSQCDATEINVEEIIEELNSNNVIKPETVEIKIETLDQYRSEDEEIGIDHGGMCANDSDENEDNAKPELEAKGSSSDDEPLSKKIKCKPKKSTDSAPVEQAQNSGAKRRGRRRIHPFGNKLGEPWACDKCKFVTEYRRSVIRHKEVHDKRENRTFPCPLCEMAFKTRLELKAHGKMHPENHFVCEICGASQKTDDAMRMHLKSHVTTEQFNCEYCTYTTRTANNLKSHMKVHSAETCKNRCEVCGATFRGEYVLKLHLESHGNERKYSCDQCPARFNTKNILRNHRNNVHLAIRYPCEYCDKRFYEKLTMRDHMERVHDIQCNFPCDICLQTFFSQEKLDQHRLRHENPKPLECGVCLAIHTSQEAFDSHVCITYRDDYQCCNKDYRNHGQYNRHMLAKHGIKTNARVKPIPGVLVGKIRGSRKRLIQCRKCDIAFPNKALKQLHMLECKSSQT